ncbi:molecular chaperone GrpE [Malonomonas rubra DSM 5091]|uniref:Protein GrpE n=1 Tax=Malonomonas rubra DSM 5091 TaxID=1122189 RepID=A0A1M6NVD1_MALRU|nr:nucleotide exchange factor GrpE [Malonomonas rubra]SHJ99719.1 molecular chaperone GrpE [Malonomonas rubra DSM 5091]
MTDEIQINTDCSGDGVTEDDNQRTNEGAVWKERYLRLLADLENTKKRLARTSAQEIEAQKASLLRDVLPVADGLELALRHSSQDEDSRNILQGIEMNRSLLGKFLSKYDVAEMDVLGQPFDPGLHESIGMVRCPGVAPNTVVRVEQKGYLLSGKLLRPAQVLIASR